MSSFLLQAAKPLQRLLGSPLCWLAGSHRPRREVHFVNYQLDEETRKCHILSRWRCETCSKVLHDEAWEG